MFDKQIYVHVNAINDAKAFMWFMGSRQVLK